MFVAQNLKAIPIHLFVPVVTFKTTQMTKILIPILVTKRLPEIKEGEPFSGAVIVRYVNPKVSPEFSALLFAYCDQSGRWDCAVPDNPLEFSESRNKVIEWYEEIELESLFPDSDISYNVAENASGKRINGTVLHQEGQNFFKNHLLKQLKK